MIEGIDSSRSDGTDIFQTMYLLNQSSEFSTVQTWLWPVFPRSFPIRLNT